MMCPPTYIENVRSGLSPVCLADHTWAVCCAVRCCCSVYVLNYTHTRQTVDKCVCKVWAHSRVVDMPTRDNRKVTYLTTSEAAQLSEWADETGKSESHLLREAVLEYLDHDRSARIEDRLERIEEKIDEVAEVSDDGGHTHTSALTKGSSTVEKVRSITKRIHRNHDAPIRENDVERAIEDIAGADDRTLDKYTNLLKKRGLLFRHPVQPVWTDDTEEWAGWVEGVTVGDDIHEYVDDYPMDMDEYDEIAEKVTQ